MTITQEYIRANGILTEKELHSLGFKNHPDYIELSEYECEARGLKGKHYIKLPSLEKFDISSATKTVAYTDRYPGREAVGTILDHGVAQVIEHGKDIYLVDETVVNNALNFEVSKILGENIAGNAVVLKGRAAKYFKRREFKKLFLRDCYPLNPEAEMFSKLVSGLIQADSFNTSNDSSISTN